jgi:hypothetical protein
MFRDGFYSFLFGQIIVFEYAILLSRANAAATATVG